MTITQNLLHLAAAFCVSVAGCGAFVWFYNRVLTRMHESVVKKVLALAMLPAGGVLGIVAFVRMRALDGTSTESTIWWLLCASGVSVMLYYMTAHLRQGKRREAGSVSVGKIAMPGSSICWERLHPIVRVMLKPLTLFNGVSRLQVREHIIEIKGLPEEFEGYRVVHLTDFHIHKTLKPSWYHRIVTEAMNLRPDVLLYGGDFISKHPHLAHIADIMKGLQAPDGVWFVRGNHDFWKSPQKVARIARRTGMRLLSNEGTMIRRGKSVIGLVGLESPYVPLTSRSRTSLASVAIPRIALVHTPDAFEEAMQLGCMLAFAGHTHGGQVRLPYFGTTLSGVSAGPLFAHGWSKMGGMATITSNGQGAFLPLRFMAPPEIVLVKLTRGQPNRRTRPHVENTAQPMFVQNPGQ